MELSKFRIEKTLSKNDALLFQDWFHFLAKDRLEIQGWGLSGSDSSWTINLAEHDAIKIIFLSETKALEVQVPEGILAVAKQILHESLQKIENNTPTPGSWWYFVYSTQHNNLDQSSLLHLQRHLGGFTSGPDKMRLARRALLEIKDETGEFPGFPKLAIQVSIKLPGAAAGPFSMAEAENMVPIVGAVLSSCFNTPLTASSSLFPINEEKLDDITKSIHSNNIQELCFRGIPIWTVLQSYRLSGAGELADRLVGAMMAYETGMSQKTDHSTLLFFVSAIEVLTVPNLKSAKKQRVSKRFCCFLEVFCAEAMDEAMAHGNFSQAFGGISRQKKFAEKLYDLRSQSVHTGYFGNYSRMPMDDAQSLKVDIVSELVTGAIAALIKQPVSLLWGHPELDPSITIRLNPTENLKLRKKAENHHKKIDKYLEYLALKDIH